MGYDEHQTGFWILQRYRASVFIHVILQTLRKAKDQLLNTANGVKLSDPNQLVPRVINLSINEVIRGQLQSNL